MNIFTKHPHSIQETYFKHLYTACIFGIKMIGGGVACCIHAVFPFLFEKTASRITLQLAKQFLERTQNPMANALQNREI